MSTGRTFRTPIRTRPQAAINDAEERAEIFKSSELGRWQKTGKLFVGLDTTGTRPFIFKGGLQAPLAYFLNMERVDEQRFRQVFLLEHKRLKIAYTPTKEYIDQSGKKVDEFVGDVSRIALIDEVARSLHITERKMDDFETVERGILQRIQHATYVGDDLVVVKLLKSLNHFRKNKALMMKSQAREENLIDSVKDKRFGSTGYAYQGLIDEQVIHRMLEKNGMLQAPVLDVILSAANSAASSLANIAVRIRNGEISQDGVEDAIVKAARDPSQDAENVYSAVVGLVAPRSYIEPVTVNAAVDGAGRAIGGKRLKFSDNPQELRYGDSQNGRVDDAITEEMVANTPKALQGRFNRNLGTPITFLSKSSSSSSSSEIAAPNLKEYSAKWVDENPKEESESEDDHDARLGKAIAIALKEGKISQ